MLFSLIFFLLSNQVLYTSQQSAPAAEPEVPPYIMVKYAQYYEKLLMNMTFLDKAKTAAENQALLKKVAEKMGVTPVEITIETKTADTELVVTPNFKINGKSCLKISPKEEIAKQGKITAYYYKSANSGDEGTYTLCMAVKVKDETKTFITQGALYASVLECDMEKMILCSASYLLAGAELSAKIVISDKKTHELKASTKVDFVPSDTSITGFVKPTDYAKQTPLTQDRDDIIEIPLTDVEIPSTAVIRCLDSDKIDDEVYSRQQTKMMASLTGSALAEIKTMAGVSTITTVSDRNKLCTKNLIVGSAKSFKLYVNVCPTQRNSICYLENKVNSSVTYRVPITSPITYASPVISITDGQATKFKITTKAYDGLVTLEEMGSDNNFHLTHNINGDSVAKSDPSSVSILSYESGPKSFTISSQSKLFVFRVCIKAYQMLSHASDTQKICRTFTKLDSTATVYTPSADDMYEYFSKETLTVKLSGIHYKDMYEQYRILNEGLAEIYSSSDSTTKSSEKSLSSLEIAFIVIGSIAGVVLITGLFYYFVIRKKD